jgi:hypothetical protein
MESPYHARACVYSSNLKFLKNKPILLKLGVKILPLEVAQSSYALIDYIQ